MEGSAVRESLLRDALAVEGVIRIGSCSRHADPSGHLCRVMTTLGHTV